MNQQAKGTETGASRSIVPAIDHSMLSPSGRCSRRAREAALKREAVRLFPPGYFNEPAKSNAQIAQEKAATLRASAKNLRNFAARGMSVGKFTRAVAKLEAEADALSDERKCPECGRINCDGGEQDCAAFRRSVDRSQTAEKGNREASNVGGSEGLKPNAPFSSVSSSEGRSNG